MRIKKEKFPKRFLFFLMFLTFIIPKKIHLNVWMRLIEGPVWCGNFDQQKHKKPQSSYIVTWTLNKLLFKVILKLKRGYERVRRGNYTELLFWDCFKIILTIKLEFQKHLSKKQNKIIDFFFNITCKNFW